MSENTLDLNKIHKEFAINYNNTSWDYFEMKNRTPEEDVEMIHTAHTSRFHWGIVGDARNLERGEWLVSRAYAEAGVEERAVYHGQLCLDICIKNGIGDFDLAFAYEGLTRAYKLGSNKAAYEHHKKLALETCEAIEKDEDKKYFLSQINPL